MKEKYERLVEETKKAIREAEEGYERKLREEIVQRQKGNAVIKGIAAAKKRSGKEDEFLSKMKKGVRESIERARQNNAGGNNTGEPKHPSAGETEISE